MEERDLSVIASRAAVEIDNMRLGRSHRFEGVLSLIQFLNERKSNPEFVFLIWQTLSEKDRDRMRLVPNVIAYIKKMVGRLEAVTVTEGIEGLELSLLTDFCVNLSRQARSSSSGMRRRLAV